MFAVLSASVARNDRNAEENRGLAVWRGKIIETQLRSAVREKALHCRVRMAHTVGALDRDTLNVSAHRESQTRGRTHRRVRPAGRIGLAEGPARAPCHLQPWAEGSARAACRH